MRIALPKDAIPAHQVEHLQPTAKRGKVDARGACRCGLSRRCRSYLAVFAAHVQDAPALTLQAKEGNAGCDANSEMQRDPGLAHASMPGEQGRVSRGHPILHDELGRLRLAPGERPEVKAGRPELVGLGVAALVFAYLGVEDFDDGPAARCTHARMQ